MAIKNKIKEDGSLTVYSYDPSSFEYIGSEQADPDPMNKGLFLLPANTTEITPPSCSKKYVLRFNCNKWQRVLIQESESFKQLCAAIRSQRNFYLAASDWTQLPDVKLKKKQWKRYRQDLRDLPLQPGFPFRCMFPDIIK